MAYNTLYQLYFKDKSNFDDVYQNRFNSETTIKFDFDINKNQAFLFLHPDHFRLVTSIYAYDKKIQYIYNNLPNVALDKYIRDSLVSEIKNSNDIEGVISTKKEINEILDQMELKKQDRLYGMVNRYKFLIEDINFPLEAPNDIRTIFDELVSQEVYENDKDDTLDGDYFRKGPVYLYKASGKVLHEGILPESSIIEW